MAIVEDEVRNDSEEENDIEVVVEDYDVEQDSDESDDDDDAVDEALERKISEIEERLKEYPYNYDDHIEVIQALWGLSALDRWRAAFDRLHQITTLKPEHWLLRLHTETTITHASENRDEIGFLFRQAALDCYSIPILSEWCTWCVSCGDPEFARSELDEILHRGGADPLSGKAFWDAKLEFEKAQEDRMSEEDETYKEQRERVLFCLEELVSRPLLRSEQAWAALTEVAEMLRTPEYVDKVKKQHEAATEYLNKITRYEDKLLPMENGTAKYKLYAEYIDAVKEMSKDEKYKDCDSDGIVKVLYDRATTEYIPCSESFALLLAYARFVRSRSSRATYWRTLQTCARRAPRKAVFWIMQMQQLEHEEKEFDNVKSVFEQALAYSMESYKETEALWLSYVEYSRRRTDFDDEKQTQLLRSTCRLAWDSLAEAWGDEANDCEIPLFWARLEYQRMNAPFQGKEIFEEIFKYGENKTMSKYWEALIHLEMGRNPPISQHKLRDLFRRALRSVTDYPPAVARMWTDFERDYGQLDTLRECNDTCEVKLKEWRVNYQQMKDKMTGKKQKPTKQADKNAKFDKKKKETTEDKPNNKGKRKSEGAEEVGGVKRKKDESSEVVKKEKEGDSKVGVKRSHGEDNGSDEGKDSKRQRRDDSTEDSRLVARDACTLFVSNLEFKVNEQNLRDTLSKYGEIVSLRVRSGVKAFGGSICYCQYKNKEAVDEAVKHDRTLLDGRPMFLSRYSAKKTKPQFKYATSTEMNKLFVRNLPYEHCTKEALAKVFDKYGKLKDVRVVTFKDGKPKGLAYIDFEDEQSAAKALEQTNGMLLGERKLEVAVSAPPLRTDVPAPTLGQQKRDGTGGMRRTQLSSFVPSVLQRTFVPSVLQKASTSKTTVATNDNDEHKNTDKTEQTKEEKRPMSNKDFRSMLLGEK